MNCNIKCIYSLLTLFCTQYSWIRFWRWFWVCKHSSFFESVLVVITVVLLFFLFFKNAFSKFWSGSNTLRYKMNRITIVINVNFIELKCLVILKASNPYLTYFWNVICENIIISTKYWKERYKFNFINCKDCLSKF